MAWEKIQTHSGEPLYLVVTEGVDQDRQPVTTLQWVGKGDRILIEQKRTPDSAHFRSHTGVVLAVTYPGEKGHGLLPDRALHLATSRLAREEVSMGEISRFVNLDFVLGQEDS